MITQSSQKIEVIVRKEGAGGEKNNKETDTDEIGGKNTASQGTNTHARLKRTLRVNAIHGFAVAKQWANADINYRLAGLEYVHGDESYADRAKRQVEILQDYGNLASSTAIGATYGAAGGPLGMALGAVLGFASSAISYNYKYKGRERDYTFKMFKENNAIEYKRARAYTSLTTGRLR